MTNWIDVFNVLKNKDYFKELLSFIDSEYQKYLIYPPKELIFNAFKLTPYNEVKVVIFGQDPYFNKGEAMGLAFSVNKDIKVPPSLKNIYKEIELEFNQKFNNCDGDLTYLAKQGVLLLNPILTVREKSPLSHDNNLYKEFTKDIILSLEENNNVIIYLLMGNKAKRYEKYITNKNHYIIKVSHPSPLGANKGGFFNSNCFKRINEILKKNNEGIINWLK